MHDTIYWLIVASRRLPASNTRSIWTAASRGSEVKNDQFGEIKKDGREPADARKNQNDKLRRYKQSAGLDHAIRLLLPYPVPGGALLALFENRAALQTIRGWRYGWFNPPDWATDIIKARFDARRRELDRVEASLPIRSSKSERWSAHWRAYHARRAAEKDKKDG